MKLIDADRVVTALLFDSETEEIEIKKMSIADYLDLCTDEGCPEEAVVLCKDCMFNTSKNKCINPDSFFQVPPDDGYCSFGKRKAEVGNTSYLYDVYNYGGLDNTTAGNANGLGPSFSI